MKIKFSKYHGCGNDFIIIDNLNQEYKLNPEQIKFLCNRHFGIGADGLILVEKRDNHYYMNYYNSDGTPAEMCGNGLRCTADFINQNIDSNLKKIIIKSQDGLHRVNINDETIEVSVKKPHFLIETIENEEIEQNVSEKDGVIHSYGFLTVGNPHLVLLVENPDVISKDVCKLLSESCLDNGTNVNLVTVNNPDNITVKTYERGDGFTLACGTGACASASYLNHLNICNNEVRVNVPGGILDVKIDDKALYLSGNAQKVFQGEIELN